MQSEATTVDACLAEAPAARRPALERLRLPCRRVLPDAEEGMENGMPAYRIGGAVRVAFAYRKPDAIDFALAETILIESRHGGTGAR